MIPAANFPDASDRYADSIRLRRAAVPKVIHVAPRTTGGLGDRTAQLGSPACRDWARGRHDPAQAGGKEGQAPGSGKHPRT